MRRKSELPGLRIVTALALIMSTPSVFVPTNAAAVGFQDASVRMDRMKVNSVTGGQICARPATTATEAKLVITFPSTYTLSTTAANWGVSTSPIPTGATAWPGITAPTGGDIDNTAKTVIFASSDLTVATLYCFNFGTGATKPVTLPAGAANSQQGYVESQTSGNAPIDSTPIALATVADDQILVTATVPPIFQISFPLGNTDTFGNLVPDTVVSTAGRTVNIATNAKGGWVAWAKDSNQGLLSTTANYTIPTIGTVDGTPSQLTVGTPGYVLDVDADSTPGCNGTHTAAPEYNAAPSTTHGGTFSSDFQPIASCAPPSAPATSNGDEITITARAMIMPSTPAGNDYSDIITVVAAGSF